MNIQEIHDRAVDAASRYRKAEAELIEILQQAEQHRVFLAKGHSSLFLYVVKELGLSESVAFNLIAVARKAREIPELKTEIQNGTITLSNARKIVPILSKENKSEWLAKARELSHRQLEKEVVKIRPQLATPERATYVTPSRVRLELGLSEKDMLKLRRVQDLFCQSRQRPVTLEEVLVALTQDFLRRHDPLERAKRHQVRKGLRKVEPDYSKESIDESASRQSLPESVKTPVALQVEHAPMGAKRGSHAIHVRKPISAELLHRINLRDERRCAFTNPKGERCKQTRWIEIHHKIPVSQGGMNASENLTTLCSAHHGWVHSHGPALRV